MHPDTVSADASLFGSTIDNIAREELSLGPDFYVTAIGAHQLDCVDPEALEAALCTDASAEDGSPPAVEDLAEALARASLHIRLPKGLLYVRAANPHGNPVWGIVRVSPEQLSAIRQDQT